MAEILRQKEEMLTTRNSAPESSQVSELEILRKTLGERRGHQRGVGRKLKGQSSGRRSQPATADQPDLRETVVELQKQIQTLTQQMSRERREPMDVEMNDAAPTQPIRPQPSRSQMGFNPMGFQQPHQTPTSFQQLLQQPLLQQPLVPSLGMLSPEQFHSQMYQSYLQFVFQSPNNSQVLLNMMTQSPQTYTRATGSRHSHRTPPPHPSSSVLDALLIEMPIVPPATNHPREPLLQNPPPVHRPAHEDNSNLYYLSSGDHPGLILVTPPLSDHNFQPWRRDFELSVGARNKTAFLKGTLPSPPEIDPLHNHWTRCNQMVMS
ncbi:hypothetical protein F8388_017284 [Cannabis sativa]|uniref:Retrotransposon Copia-like N-terminal domain-containing protein n=1 Tax=Cannabis sativa TaxID=3483 RepID=A0A7J6FWS2_CANSA|nr:hypothetical protein F8388_017284 [Cannabis sativa]KAF4402045.1 hypothetical protein G4B88_017557 [Cannabis sativa]